MSRLKVRRVPLSQLKDVPAVAWEPGRVVGLLGALKAGTPLPPIRITIGPDGQRELEDGNHRLWLARMRGEKSIEVEFSSPKAALPQAVKATPDSHLLEVARANWAHARAHLPLEVLRLWQRFESQAAPKLPRRAPPASAFKEAVAWFRAKVPLHKLEWLALEGRAREKAFTVAGVANLDLIYDVWKAIDKAVAKGETLESFRKRVVPALEREWGGEIPGRVETIFRTNTQLAYSRGRSVQMREPAVLRVRPFWRYNALLDGRTTEGCRALHNTVLPAHHTFWRTHTPPRHFNCRSAIQTLTREGARALGITDTPPQVPTEEGFGRADALEWQPELDTYPHNLAEVYRRGK